MGEALDYLRESPVALMLVTVVGYRLGRELQRRSGGHPVAQPVLVAIVVVGLSLWALGADYATYATGSQFISFWLGPATVALAVPLHRQVHRLPAVLGSMLVAIPAGAAVSLASAYGLVRLLGGEPGLAMTMAPRTVTTPVALQLSEAAGGNPSLTAVFVIISGVLGAIAGPAVLTLARVHDRRARGLAMGASAHAIGTSRALLEDETEGAFAGLAMGLTALAASILMPVLVLVVT